MLTPLSFFRSLVQSFPDALLGISVAVDGRVFQMDVHLASYPPTQTPHPCKLSKWGGCAVIVLISIWLGIDGVNPIIYETTKGYGSPSSFICVRLTSMNTKALYTLPQSVGIAGRCPSSSYYFVGFQVSYLFSLVLQHACATIPLRRRNVSVSAGSPVRQAMPDECLHLPAVIVPRHRLRPASRTGSSTFSYDGITIAFIKMAIIEQLTLRKKRIRALELGGCQWWRIGTVG